MSKSAHLVAYARAPGEVTVDDGSTHPGNLGYLAPIETITGVFGWLGSSSGDFELGLSERLAATASVGLQRTSLELRVSLLDQRRGAPLSVAAAAGPRIGAAALFQGGRAAGAQAGLDVSRTWRGRDVFANLYLTWASELYMRSVGVLPDRECYGSCHVVFARREVRLVAGLGMLTTSGYGLALVPYRVLDAELIDLGSRQTEATGVASSWGASLVLTQQF